MKKSVCFVGGRPVVGYRFKLRARAIVVALVWSVTTAGAGAETLPAVLAKAYQQNPQLNAQRAFVRQTQEQIRAGAGRLLSSHLRDGERRPAI